MSRSKLAGTGNSVTVGSGNDTIRTGAGANTFVLDGSTTTMVLQGSNNKVLINGGVDQIEDAPARADNLFLQVGQSGGAIMIGDFSATNGAVDLATAWRASCTGRPPLRLTLP